MGSEDEIITLRQRIEQAEGAIAELREKDLLIAKRLAEALYLEQHRVALVWLHGRATERDFEQLNKKLGTARKKFRDAVTVEDVLEVKHGLDLELSEYMRAEKVKTAEEAMDIAHAFVKKYSAVALPLKAVKEGDVWVVDMDVGALNVKVANVRVDAKTGDILGYDVPQK